MAGLTVQEVWDAMSQLQKDTVYWLVGEAVAPSTRRPPVYVVATYKTMSAPKKRVANFLVGAALDDAQKKLILKRYPNLREESDGSVRIDSGAVQAGDRSQWWSDLWARGGQPDSPAGEAGVQA